VECYLENRQAKSNLFPTSPNWCSASALPGKTQKHAKHKFSLKRCIFLPLFYYCTVCCATSYGEI